MELAEELKEKEARLGGTTGWVEFEVKNEMNNEKSESLKCVRLKSESLKEHWEGHLEGVYCG